MIVRRKVFDIGLGIGISVEVHWFDTNTWLASKATIALLRCAKNSAAQTSAKWPEATATIDLTMPESEWLASRSKKFRNQWRKVWEDYSLKWVSEAESRREFYRHYIEFARSRNLGIPDPSEESDLEIVLVRNLSGELAYGAAFLPIPSENRYRYRYGMHLKPGLAGQAALASAMRRAREIGFKEFDLGGITPVAKPGSAAAGINAFKAKFGGKPEEIWVCARSGSAFFSLPLWLCVLAYRNVLVLKRKIDSFLYQQHNQDSE